MRNFFYLFRIVLVIIMVHSCSSDFIIKQTEPKPTSQSRTRFDSMSDKEKKELRKKRQENRKKWKRYIAADIVKVNINQEVVVPFCKSNIEIWFRNNATEGDTSEGKFRFVTNKNSFIKSMQLQINGIWEKDITFQRNTGEAIYNELTGQNGRPVDPAILEKSGENEYYLRVFPVTDNEIRKVRLEMYSILESKDSLNLTWHFNSYNRFTRHRFVELGDEWYELNLKHNKIDDFKVSIVDDTLYSKYYNYLDFTDEVSSGITLNYSNISNHNHYKINDFYFCDKLDDISIDLIKSQQSLEVLQRMLESDDKMIIIEKWTFQKDKFINDFVNYLREYKKLDIFFGCDWWHHPLEQFMLNDNYVLSYNENISYDTIISAQCDFINEFEDYFTEYHVSEENQVKKGLMTRNTVKLVPENSQKAHDIIQKHLEIEKDWESAGPDESRFRNGRVGFITYEAVPNPIGGYSAIQRSLIYPKKAIKKKIEGTVVLNVYIHPNGVPDKIKVIKSLHPILDLAAKRTIKQIIFTPVKQREKAVGVYIYIPVVFNIEKYKKNEHGTYNNSWEEFDKKFTFDIRHKKVFATDENYNAKNSKRYKYNTPAFYELLIDNPEMIKYVYNLFLRRVDVVELSFKDNSYSFELKKPRKFLR